MKWETEDLEYSLCYMVYPICQSRDFYITFYSVPKKKRTFCFSFFILPDCNAQQLIYTYIYLLMLHTKGGTYLTIIGENKFIW